VRRSARALPYGSGRIVLSPMPSDSSFDIVSEINLQEMDNAVNQAIKEVTTRYDFKGTAASLEFNRKDKELTLTADGEPQLESVRKVLVEKMVKRGVDPKSLDPQKFEQATHKTVRQKVKLTAPVKIIAGRIDGQTCFEESGLCELFRKTFTANLD